MGAEPRLATRPIRVASHHDSGPDESGSHEHPARREQESLRLLLQKSDGKCPDPREPVLRAFDIGGDVTGQVNVIFHDRSRRHQKQKYAERYASSQRLYM